MASGQEVAVESGEPMETPSGGNEMNVADLLQQLDSIGAHIRESDVKISRELERDTMILYKQVCPSLKDELVARMAYTSNHLSKSRVDIHKTKQIIQRIHERITAPSKRKRRLAREDMTGGITFTYNDWEAKTKFPLHHAAEKGDIKLVERLLQEIKLDEPGQDGESVLSRACVQGHVDVLELLLSRGADVTQVDKSGNTPLHYASWCEEAKPACRIIDSLIQNGAKVNQKARGHECILNACSVGFVSVVQKLVENGADVNSLAAGGMTPLLALVQDREEDTDNRRLKVARYLLKQGAQLDVPSYRLPYCTAVWHAINKGHQAVAVVLLKHLAQRYYSMTAELAWFGVPDDVKAEGVVEMLNVSVVRGYVNVTKELLKAMQATRGPLFTARSHIQSSELTEVRVRSKALLHHAAAKGHALLVAELLSRCPRLASTRDGAGETSLFTAVRDRNLPVIYAHLDDEIDEQGMCACDPSLTNDQGLSCIDLANQLGEKDIKAALYVTAPPEGMDKGTWLRTFFYNERNLIKFCHDKRIAQPIESAYTFAPMAKLGEEERGRLTEAQDVYDVSKDGGHGGHAIILYNWQFHSGSETRQGGHMDVIHLGRLFTTLQFEVKIWMNLTADEIHEHIDKLREKLYYDKMLVFIVMSHGGPGYIEGTDGDLVFIDEDIIAPFDGDNLPRMQGKPKLFFIQACRGRRGGVDGAMMDSASEETWATPRDIHPKSDIIVIYSTYGDFAALRDPTHGSWFIEEFVLCYELFSHLDHLEDITRKANYLLSRRKQFGADAVQVAQVETSLRRKLYLFRMPQDDDLHSRLQRLTAKLKQIMPTTEAC